MWKLLLEVLFFFLFADFLVMDNFFFSPVVVLLVTRGLFGVGWGPGVGGADTQTFQTQKAAVLECALAYERARGIMGPGRG